MIIGDWVMRTGFIVEIMTKGVRLRSIIERPSKNLIKHLMLNLFL